MEKIEKPYLDDVGSGRFLSNLKNLFSLKSHSHKASDISDLKDAIGELSNTTYTLIKNGNDIVLVGSDGSEMSVTETREILKDEEPELNSGEFWIQPY